MRNLIKLSLFIVPLSGYAASPVSNYEEDINNFRVTGSLQSVFDSNYTRTPEKFSEQITQTSLGVSLNENWSNQKFNLRWQGTHYAFNELFDSNASLQTGVFDWKSLWPKGFKSSLSLKREGYLADQLEFSGIDVSTQDVGEAKIGYGFTDGWAFSVGGRGFKQLHSNDERRRFEYDEADAFVELGYTTPIGSSIVVRARDGKRTYQEDALIIEDLNYDYTQAEVETTLLLSTKTHISFLIAGYNRDGDVNNGTGTMASFDAQWLPTEKLTFSALYSLQNPSIGEREDGTSEVHTVLFSAQWQMTQKFTLGSRVSFARSYYVSANPLFDDRHEGLTNYSPLSISYAPSTHWRIKFDSSLRQNNSTLAYRKYESAQATLGVFFDYL